jgi:hypothetical protein
LGRQFKDNEARFALGGQSSSGYYIFIQWICRRADRTSWFSSIEELTQLMSSVRRQILRYAIGLLIASGFLFLNTYREWKGNQGASASAEAISLEQLIARGPEGNPHLLLRDYTPCGNYTAIPNRQGDGWGRVYVPLIPGKLPKYNEPLPQNTDKVEVLVRYGTIKEPHHLSLLRNPSGIRGLVINSIDPLSSRDRDALQEHYPGIDLSRCVIVEEGRAPSDEFSLQLSAGLGGFLLLGGLLLLGWFAWLGMHRPPVVSAVKSIPPRNEVPSNKPQFVSQVVPSVEEGDELETYEELVEDSKLVERARNLMRWPAIALLVVGFLGLTLDLLVAGFLFVDDFITPLTETSLLRPKEQKAKQIPAQKKMSGGAKNLVRLKQWKGKKGVTAKSEEEAKRTEDQSKEVEEYDTATAVFGITLLLSLAAASAIAVGAGFSMIQLRRYWLSVVGSFAVMPGGCFCCLIGLPAGIWSLVVLFKPEVRSSFR